MLFMIAGSAIGSTGGASAQTQDQNGELHGLRGDYYISTGPGVLDFKELRSSVIDPNTAFDDLNPILTELTGQSDNAAVRWTGFIQPKFSEDYTFSMMGDHGLD